MTRSSFVLGLATVGLTFVIACSSGGANESGDNGSSGAPGSSGNDGAGGNGNGGSGSTDGSSFKQCRPATARACSDADMQPYNECIANSCGTAFTKCYGPDYRKGSFTGPCGDFVTCAQKCDCNDTACVQACVTGTSSAECSTCSKEIDACSSSCTLPACASQSPDAGGSATCADLEACCNAISDPDQKATCIGVKDGAQGNDAKCGPYVNAFRTAGFCP